MSETTQANALHEIKLLFSELASGRQDYDFLPPALVSHVEQYASQPERLRKYARQVISGRIMIFLVSSRMNTQVLLQSYILGVEARNPFSVLLAARSQLELLFVVADTINVIRQNAGEHTENFVKRVRKVDEALINATFGTRSSLVKDMMSKIRVSRLRSATPEDDNVLKSKNVLTHLERLSRDSAYSECKADYERLCEYVHPNYGMNMLHVVASPHPKLLRFSLASREPFDRALAASATTMVRAARETVAAMDKIHPPFGQGILSTPSPDTPG